MITNTLLIYILSPSFILFLNMLQESIDSSDKCCTGSFISTILIKINCVISPFLLLFFPLRLKCADIFAVLYFLTVGYFFDLRLNSNYLNFLNYINIESIQNSLRFDIILFTVWVYRFYLFSFVCCCCFFYLDSATHIFSFDFVTLQTQ